MNDRTLPATINASVPSLVMNEQELITVLQNSLYPGASLPSIKMVLGYCKAAGYDPMQKPAHIVPMWDSKAGQMRDVIMPGVGLYRTQAARTGQFAGMTEPEFGPDVTETIGGVSVTYPQWCRVTVKRQLENGTVAEFTAREFWKENYAVKGGKEKSIAPNSMWARRVYGQLAKCTQAQALRIAFPEATGAGVTADEMEGKPIDEGVTIEHEQTKPSGPPPYADADFQADLPKFTKLIKSGKKTAEQIITMVSSKVVPTDAQKVAIMALAPKPETAVTFAAVAEKLQKAPDEDLLDAEADLIRSVADEGQRAELQTIYQKRKAEFEVTR